MLGRVVGTAGASLLLCAALFTGVATADPPNRGCPPGFILVTTSFVIEELDNGNAKDQNGDGLVCAKLNKGQTEKNGTGSYTIKDNTNPEP